MKNTIRFIICFTMIFICGVIMNTCTDNVYASFKSDYKSTKLEIKKLSMTKDGIKLKINKNKNSSGYVIYRREDGSEWEELAWIKKAVYYDTEYETGVEYQYKIKGYTYYKGMVIYTKATKSDVIYGVPQSVKGVTAINDAEGQVTLTWEPNAEASGYYIYRRENYQKWKKLDVIVDADENTYIDTTVVAGNVYQYKVIPFEIIDDIEYVGYKKVDGTNAYRDSCIDVSYHNGKIKWSKVSADGVDFAFLRAGWGYNVKKKGGVIDEQFDRNVRLARKNGIKIGVYLYSTARSVEDAKKEAKFLLKTIKKYGEFDGPIVYDFESLYRKGKKYKKENTKIITTFCDMIEEAGYDALVYSDNEMLTKYVNTKKISKYGLWVAYWTYDINRYPVVLDNVQYWQYADNGRISGIKEYVDRNITFVIK